jgi:drug/metabolite transporter (DMT)-like permease
MLAILMVITGTLNTIIAKWTTTEEARNTIGIKDTFDHPFLQSTGYFFGEFMCLLVYFFYLLVLKIRRFVSDDDEPTVKIMDRRREIRELVLDNNVEVIDVEEDEHESSNHSTPMRPVRKPYFNTRIEEFEDEDVEEDSDFDRVSSIASSDSGAISSDSEAAVVLSVNDDLLKREPVEFTWRNYYLFLFPAILDVCATSSMYVGLYLTSASSYQMLRGSVIIFTGLASRFFLRKKLHWYKWLGMFVILGGLFIVGCADLFSKKCDLLGISDDGSGGFVNDTIPSEINIGMDGPCDEETERFHSIIGDTILICAQIIVAFQGTYEEKLLKKYRVAPILAMGLEGFFGFSILSCLLVLFKHIGTGSKDWGHSPLPPYYLEDAYDGLVQLKNDHALLGAFIGVIISISIFNVTGITVTQEMSATTRMVLDTVRTIFIWPISLGLQWQSFHFLQPLGFFFIIVGMCFYYNLLIVPNLQKIWQFYQQNHQKKKNNTPPSLPSRIARRGSIEDKQTMEQFQS